MLLARRQISSNEGQMGFKSTLNNGSGGRGSLGAHWVDAESHLTGSLRSFGTPGTRIRGSWL